MPADKEYNKKKYIYIFSSRKNWFFFFMLWNWGSLLPLNSGISNFIYRFFAISDKTFKTVKCNNYEMEDFFDLSNVFSCKIHFLFAKKAINTILFFLLDMTLISLFLNQNKNSLFKVFNFSRILINSSSFWDQKENLLQKCPSTNSLQQFCKM